MGILDQELSKHLKIIKQYYKSENSSCLWNYEHELDSSKAMKSSTDAPLSIGDVQKSEKLRNLGNETWRMFSYFETGSGNAALEPNLVTKSYRKALRFYTKSIAAAIRGPVCALAYAERSAVLFWMQLYEDSLKDIQRAFDNDHDEKFDHKLYLLQARCLKHLGRDYSESVKKAMENIDEYYQADHLLKLKADFTKELEMPELKFSGEILKPNEWTLPPLSYGASYEVPSFSSAVTLSEDSEMGRCLVANQDIKTGDVLVVDESVVSYLAPETEWDYCTKCFKFCFSLVPCKVCGDLMYCSEKCRDGHWDGIHGKVCQIIKQQDQHVIEIDSTFDKTMDRFNKKISNTPSTTTYFQGHMISNFGLENMRDLVANNKTIHINSLTTVKGFKDGQFTNNLHALVSLEENMEKMSALEKVTIVSCGQAGFYGVPKSELLPMSAMLAKCLAVMITHKKTAVFTNKKDYVKVPVGYTLNMGCGLINHSCDPNMYCISYGNTAVYRAARPIKKGEQLSESYGDVNFLHQDWDDRQRTLFCTDFNFYCKCIPCKKKWPLLKKMPQLDLKNDDVQNRFLSVGLDPKDMTEEFKKILSCLKNGTVADLEILPKLLLLLEELHQKKNKLNQWYYNLQESIKKYYLIQGNAFL